MADMYHPISYARYTYYTAYGTGSTFTWIPFGFTSEHIMIVVSNGDSGVASWSWTNSTVHGQMEPGESAAFDDIEKTGVSLKSNSNASTNVRLWAW